MSNLSSAQFLIFLREDLSLSHDSIALASRSIEQDIGLWPMTLWQYGMVTLEQVDRIYDWLETSMENNEQKKRVRNPPTFG